jgi:hypothetical protein
MADDDSDVDFSDFDSLLSSSLHITSSSKPNPPHPVLSTDRLYSLSTPLKHPESEHTPLLFNNSPAQRSYHSTRTTPQHDINSPFDSSGEYTSPQPLQMLTRKISRVFQSKAYDYDNDKSSLAAVGSGERVWYLTPREMVDLGLEIIGRLIGFMILSKISFGRRSYEV